MSLEYKFQPLEGNFPRDLTREHKRQKSNFGKSWTDVQNILERELNFLKYRHGSVVLQTAHSPWDVRKDGKLRSDVRRPEHPGVVIKFDAMNPINRRYELMSFECDQFTEWKANVRAIADAMEALRKVNRYGVSGSGKSNAHYEGYKALPAGNPESGTFEAAAKFISFFSGFTRDYILINRENLSQAYKLAATKLHPDSPSSNGNHENFIKLQKAKEILEKHFIN